MCPVFATTPRTIHNCIPAVLQGTADTGGPN